MSAPSTPLRAGFTLPDITPPEHVKTLAEARDALDQANRQLCNVAICYKLRVNKNGQYIDIVHADADAGPGAGCIARIPIRSGFEFDAIAFDRATLICAFLNEHEAG